MVEYTVAQIQQQNLVASHAYASGQITGQQYNDFMTAQYKLEAAARARESGQTQPTTQTQPAPVYKTVPTTGLMPQDPSDNVYVGGGADTGLYVRDDYTVTNTQETQTPEGTKTTYTIAPIAEPPTPIQDQPHDTPLTSGILQGGSELPLVNPITNTAPVIDTSEKRTVALEIITAAAAPVIGPAKIVIGGELLGAGLATVPTIVRASQGEPITVTDVAKSALEGAAVGGGLSLVGGAVIEGIGATGGGAVATIERVGVNTAIGAGTSAVIEGATTGKVTPETVALGAAFGAGFGAATELGAMGSTKVKESITNSETGQRVQNNLDRNAYSIDTNTGAKNGPELSLTDKVVAGVTGMTPNKPAPNVIELPTIPTAPKESMTTYRGFETKEVQSNLPITNTKGELVDVIKFKDTVTTSKDYVMEKTTPESIGMTSKQVGSANAADMLDTGSVLMGRSVEPSEYYGTGKVAAPKETKLPEFKFNGEDLIPTETGELSFTGGKAAVSRPNEAIPTLGSFRSPKEYSGLKEIKGNIQDFPTIPKGDTGLDEAIFETRKYTVPERSTGDYWENTKASKTDNGLIQEITTGKAAEATGIEKVMGDMQSGRTVELGKTSVASRSIASVRNPFATSTSPSYYKQREQASEIEDVVYATKPGSELRLNNTGSFRVPTISDRGFTGVNERQDFSQPTITAPRIGGLTEPTISGNPIIKPIDITSTFPITGGGTTPIEMPVTFPVTGGKTITTSMPTQSVTNIPGGFQTNMPTVDVPQIKIPTFTSTKLNYPSGGQNRAFGYSMPRGKRSGKYGFGITEFPVLTAEDILGGSKKRKS